MKMLVRLTVHVSQLKLGLLRRLGAFEPDASDAGLACNSSLASSSLGRAVVRLSGLVNAVADAVADADADADACCAPTSMATYLMQITGRSVAHKARRAYAGNKKDGGADKIRTTVVPCL